LDALESEVKSLKDEIVPSKINTSQAQQSGDPIQSGARNVCR